MDPVSVVSIVAGLAGSLATILATFHKFTHSSTFAKLGDSYAHAEELSVTLSRDLVRVQNNLHTNFKDAQVEELLNVLQAIEKDLDSLQEMIQSANIYRKKRLSLRRFPWRRDTRAAATSIQLAKNMIHMIRTVQEHGHGEYMHIESEGSHDQSSLDSLNTALKPRYYWPLLNAPSTKAEEIFAWIAGPEGPEGQEKIHDQCRAERIAGTCEWFLEREDFRSWIQHPSSIGEKPIFWCQGRPGIGKTMLASKIIEHLQPLHVVAYFYISSGKLHSASDVVTSLLRQLCLPLHIVPNRLQQIFEQTNGERSYKPKLEDLLETLMEVSRSIHQPVTIVVDGLDEINIRKQSDFVQVFDKLKFTSWKCLVTSRNTRCGWPEAQNRYSQCIIEDDANEQDISNFVKSVLRENEPVDRILDSDPDFRSMLIETLTSRAHGMFYWVTLQMRLILDQTHLSGIRSALNSIPCDIREIAYCTLKMMKLQDNNRAELANRALALLTAAQAPLTAEAMCHALGFPHILDERDRPPRLSPEEIPNPESIIECCMGLIKMEPSTRIVTLAHYDILQEMRKEWAEFFAPEHTKRLAKTCIAYLSLAEFSRGPCHELDTFRGHLEDHPFLYYASHHWGYHARAALALETVALETVGSTISDDIHWFLEQPMNLGLSLQISEYDPEGKQKSILMDPQQCLGVSGLQVASRHGLATIIQDILETSPDMTSKQDSNGRTALHEAAQAGWESIVYILIKAGADTSSIDDEKKTPFFYAAERGHDKTMAFLENGPRRSGHDQKTLDEALCDAAEAGKASVVKRLLKFGADADSSKNGCSAMTIASREGHKDVVNLLLEAEANLSYPETLPADSIPLHQAIRNDHVDIAALLLGFGADIEARDDSGRTALFETLNTPDIRGAALLLKNGVDISCCDTFGNNILHEAATRGAVEHALRFLDRGVAMDILNVEGLRPLHLAVRHGQLKIAFHLLQKGAFPNDCDANGQTPLMYAVSAGNTPLRDLLLSFGASVNAVEIGAAPRTSREPTGYGSDINVKTPLAVAAASGQNQNFGFHHGAEIDERRISSKTTLMLAAEAGHTEVLKRLVNFGISMDDLEAALMLAAKAGHTEVVRLLVSSGVNVKDSEAALMLAAKAGHTEVVKLLSSETALMLTAEAGRTQVLESSDATDNDLEIAK